MTRPADEILPTSLSVVMPVYNEAGDIETVARDYLAILDSFAHGELVLVNDASTDDTWGILEKLARKDPRVRIFTNERNRGHGPTLMRAYREAQGEYVFQVDSDNQFVADDFWLLWDGLQKEGADIAIGKRVERNDPFARLILTRCLKLALFALFGLYPPDANAPFRLYKRAVLESLLPYVPPSELLPSICLTVSGYRLGYKTVWIRVRHLARGHGQSLIRSFKIFKIVLKAVGELFTFRAMLSRHPQPV